MLLGSTNVRRRTVNSLLNLGNLTTSLSRRLSLRKLSLGDVSDGLSRFGDSLSSLNSIRLGNLGRRLGINR